MYIVYMYAYQTVGRDARDGFPEPLSDEMWRGSHRAASLLIIAGSGEWEATRHVPW